ncbi:hypothetical protein [Fictibacillus gelatini]|uniref:hypothetical protein n=1 Tax=Fictibacillus gelatini TaxID=225985 RepID=UPI00068566F1|nr:hypothetical protein [Fictibacillus gelatini]
MMINPAASLAATEEAAIKEAAIEEVAADAAVIEEAAAGAAVIEEATADAAVIEEVTADAAVIEEVTADAQATEEVIAGAQVKGEATADVEEVSQKFMKLSKKLTYPVHIDICLEIRKKAAQSDQCVHGEAKTTQVKHGSRECASTHINQVVRRASYHHFKI